MARLTDSALLLLLIQRGLPFMDAELLDEVSLTGKKKNRACKPAHHPCLARNAHKHMP